MKMYMDEDVDRDMDKEMDTWKRTWKHGKGRRNMDEDMETLGENMEIWRHGKHGDMGNMETRKHVDI